MSGEAMAVKTEEIVSDPSRQMVAMLGGEDLMSLDAPSALPRDGGDCGERSDAGHDPFNGDYLIVDFPVQCP